MSFSALIPVILCYIISLVFSRLNPAYFSILKSEISPEHKGVRVVRSPLQGKIFLTIFLNLLLANKINTGG